MLTISGPRTSQRHLTLLLVALIISISISIPLSSAKAFALDGQAQSSFAPAIKVFLSDGVTPYSNQVLRYSDKVIVQGSGFDPQSNIGGRGVPIPNTLPQGTYVVIGSFAKDWQPSASIPSTQRSVLFQKWALTNDVLNQVPDAYKGIVAKDSIPLSTEGSFQTELTITALEKAIEGGRFGIYTYPAGGVNNPSQELYLPLNISTSPQDQNNVGDPGTNNPEKLPDVIPNNSPKVVVTPTTFDPTIANTITVTGSNFVGDSAANGVYIVVGPTSLWSGNAPLPSEGWNSLTWVMPNQVQNGTFNVTIPVPANSLDPNRQYQVATSAAHALSATNRDLDTFTNLTLKVSTGITPPTTPVVPPTTQPQVEVQSNQVSEQPQCSARTISAANLEWGIKRSFISYLQSSIAAGKITTSGVTDTGSTFKFAPGKGEFNEKEFLGEIAFPGSATFEGHSGILYVNLNNIRIRITSATTGTLYASYTASDMSANKVSKTNVAIASLGFTSKIQSDTLTLTGTKTTLLGTGTEAFGKFYKAGESLELINVSAPLGNIVVCGIKTTRATTGGLPVTGTNSTSLVDPAFILIAFGTIIVFLNKKRKYARG